MEMISNKKVNFARRIKRYTESCLLNDQCDSTIYDGHKFLEPFGVNNLCK